MLEQARAAEDSLLQDAFGVEGHGDRMLVQQRAPLLARLLGWLYGQSA